MQLATLECALPSVDVIGTKNPKEQNIFDLHFSFTEQQSLLPEDGILNQTSSIEHSIDAGYVKPVHTKPYIFSPDLQSKIRAEIERMTRQGIIGKVQENAFFNTIVRIPKLGDAIHWV